jgi:hypothetical protein
MGGVPYAHNNNRVRNGFRNKYEESIKKEVMRKIVREKIGKGGAESL